ILQFRDEFPGHGCSLEESSGGGIGCPRQAPVGGSCHSTTNELGAAASPSAPSGAQAANPSSGTPTLQGESVRSAGVMHHLSFTCLYLSSCPGQDRMTLL